jgi:hypothetical protein
MPGLGGQELGFILILVILFIVGSKFKDGVVDASTGLWRRNAPDAETAPSANPGNRAEDF